MLEYKTRWYILSLIKNEVTMKLKIILYLCATVLLCSVSVQAGGRYFVDMDGDGFDDNIIDFDNNNIPDEFQVKVKEIKSHTRTFTFSPASIFSKKANAVNLTVSQQFALHKFKARMLSQNRSNFESSFNSGLGVSASSSSGCVGGVCF